MDNAAVRRAIVAKRFPSIPLAADASDDYVRGILATAPAGAAALHLRDEVERNALLADEAYRRQFRKDYDSKFGVRVWHRDFFDAEIVG